MTDYDTLARYLPHVLADDGLLVLESAARTEPEVAGLACARAASTAPRA
jgi:hypothetical protein